MRGTEKTVHLLWTGGWDSTYRLLYLLREGRKVQPHYIIDPSRPSSGHELCAIKEISERINQNVEQLPGTLLPAEISRKTSSVQCKKVQEAYNAIVQKMYIGEQYMWLADYCEVRGIEGMEIGVEQNPIILRAVNSTGYPYTEIFGKFFFPILSTSKLEMKEWAETTGTLPILELTWFCHRPTANGEPCGKCHPCEVTVHGGMAYRLPLSARIRYHFRIIPRVRSIVKRFPRFYYVLYSLKHKNR